MYELLHSLNFSQGLMVHINAHFAFFMEKHNIYEDLYLCCIIIDYTTFLFLIATCCIFNSEHFVVQTAG
jgi:hypothetical protein